MNIIISINVHERPEYLINQIQNIKQYVKVSNNIILNCNKFMFDILKNNQDIDCIINPDFFEKKTYHGSLTKGIISNMIYTLNNYEFDYFLIMSSREFFYNELISENQILKNIYKDKINDYTKNDWHWPIFRNTKLYKHLQNNNLYYSYSAHEGMCFDRESCEYIINFLDNNLDISEDIFNFNHCVEEFALQSICCNFKPFYYIGNGVYEKSLDQVEKTKFTHKKTR